MFKKMLPQQIEKDGKYTLPDKAGHITVEESLEKITILLGGKNEAAFSLENITFPANVKEITILGGSVESLAPLNGIALRGLMLDSCDVWEFTALPLLEELSVYASEEKDLSFLGEFSMLQALDISQTPAHDFSFVKKLAHLEELFVEESQIQDVTPIAACKTLKVLSLLDSPCLTDISPLKELPQLAELTLGDLSSKDGMVMLIGDEIQEYFEKGNVQ